MYEENKMNGTNMTENVLQYFGAEDLVINCAAQVHDKQRKHTDFSF